MSHVDLLTSRRAQTKRTLRKSSECATSTCTVVTVNTQNSTLLLGKAGLVSTILLEEGNGGKKGIRCRFSGRKISSYTQRFRSFSTAQMISKRKNSEGKSPKGQKHDSAKQKPVPGVKKWSRRATRNRRVNERGKRGETLFCVYPPLSALAILFL